MRKNTRLEIYITAFVQYPNVDRIPYLRKDRRIERVGSSSTVQKRHQRPNGTIKQHNSITEQIWTRLPEKRDE